MKNVRFGVIGLGNMGSYHVGSIAELKGASLGAICDIDAARREKFTQNYNVPAFDQHQKLLDSGLVDAVIVAVPHYDHPVIALDAFAKGIHVLVEKPVCVTVGVARHLNEQRKKYPNLAFGIMFNQRTIPLYIKMRDLIAEGELGEISRVTWLITDWFRTWTYYASGGWRATWAGEGGGVLINQCPHNLDLIQWITGMVPSRITGVASIGKTHPIEVEDEVSAIFEYANGAIGHFVTTTGEATGTNRLEIVGDRGKLIAEKGKLIFTRLRQSARELNQKSPDGFPNPEKWEFEVPIPRKVDGHAVITQNFIDHILNKTPLISPGEEGVKGLEIGNAMLMSGLTRKPVDLPMDGDVYEQFIRELAQKYGGKKNLATKAATQTDMAGTFGNT